jgi:chromosome segregation ATPase
MSSDDTASPRQRIKDLEQRLDGLQVRYELACNGRRDAEADKADDVRRMADDQNKIHALQSRLNVALDTIADLKAELNNTGFECMVLRDRVRVLEAAALNKLTGGKS